LSLLHSSRRPPAAAVNDRPFRTSAAYSPTAPRFPPAQDFSSDAASHSQNKNCLRPEPVLFLFQRDHQLALQYIQELFSLVGIGIAAARIRRHAKKMWLHHGIPPSQQLHANAGTSFQHFSLSRLHLPAARPRRIKKIQNVGFIKSRQLAQRSHRPAHLQPLEPPARETASSSPAIDASASQSLRRLRLLLDALVPPGAATPQSLLHSTRALSAENAPASAASRRRPYTAGTCFPCAGAASAPGSPMTGSPTAKLPRAAPHLRSSSTLWRWMSSWLAGKGIQVFYPKERVFILDSTRASSLTLRDYSKVVAGHKLSFSRKKPTPQDAGEDAWRFHAVTASPLDHDVSG